MTLKTLSIAAMIATVSLGATAALADNHGDALSARDAQAFLTAPTSLTQALTAAEAATGGKVFRIEFEVADHGGVGMILAQVLMPDGAEQRLSINPADGHVTPLAMDAEDDDGDGDHDGN